MITIKKAVFHPKARDIIREFPEGVRVELGRAIFALQAGELLAMPLSRPLSIVAPGVSELRVKWQDNIYRVIYYLRSEQGILIFHAFIKRTQKTLPLEILLARKRLKELRHGEA
jgi:phage-related protein